MTWYQKLIAAFRQGAVEKTWGQHDCEERGCFIPRGITGSEAVIKKQDPESKETE